MCHVSHISDLFLEYAYVPPSIEVVLDTPSERESEKQFAAISSYLVLIGTPYLECHQLYASGITLADLQPQVININSFIYKLSALTMRNVMSLRVVIFVINTYESVVLEYHVTKMFCTFSLSTDLKQMICMAQLQFFMDISKFSNSYGCYFRIWERRKHRKMIFTCSSIWSIVKAIFLATCLQYCRNILTLGTI